MMPRCSNDGIRTYPSPSTANPGVVVPLRDASWFRALTEGAIIVGSILLAFGLDAWWDDRAHRAELRNQLEVVAREMVSTREALNRVLNAHDMNARLAAHLSSTLGGVSDGSEVLVSDTLVGLLLPQVTADVTTGSLGAFIEAGGLELIDDADIRRDLLDWPTRIDDLRDDEIYLRNFAATDLASYLRANAAVANAELRSIPFLMGRVGAGPPVDPASLGTLTLRREQQLMNLLAARESQERAVHASLVELMDQATQIIAELEGLQ
jgi:hypothetical protein